MSKNENRKTEYRALPWFGIPALRPYVKPYLPTVIFMVVLGSLSSLADSVYPLFNRYALNHFVAGRTLEGLPLFAVANGTVLAAQVLINYVSIYSTCRVEAGVDRDLRNAAFTHLQTLSFSYFNHNSVGYIHARVMSDTSRIGELVSWRLMDMVWNLSYLIFIFAVMLSIRPELGGMILLLVPAAVFLGSRFQKKLVFLNRRIREINSRITGNFNEGITGARTVKTLGVEDRIIADFRKDTEEMRRTSVRSAHYSALFVSTISFMGSLALALVLWKGGRLTQDGLMKIGTLSVFMSYALGMMDPIRNIVETISSFITIQVNIERLTKLIGTPSDVTDTPEVTAKYGDVFHAKRENWEPLYGDVEFRNVTFRYPDGEDTVLENFSLKVPRGTNVAIVGETGAGKSTLVNLVCRFYEPTSGQVLIDGVDVRKRSQLWLHSSIGYVLQTPHLFSGSVRENLKYGKPDATDEEICRALEAVSADSVVAGMEKGLDSEVGEGGDLLSAGEKQLLSFARAVLSDPAILVLDEATSSIDTVTEKKMQDAIHTLTEGRTSFVIAHRLSTIVGADLILVVRDGRIIEQGTHHSLMQQRGSYYDLYTRQFEELVVDMT